MSMKRGLFISVEGIDGAGKSTHIPYIKSYLESKGYKVIVTREPGGTELGDKIRKLLLHENMHEVTELLLMFASRQELISQIIEPNLALGNCIISDRFVDSSFAYQGYGRDIGFDRIFQLKNLLSPAINTNLTLVFDVSIATAKLRLNSTRGNSDRIESENDEFFSKVRNAYLDMAKLEPQRIKVVNAEQTINEIQFDIQKNLDELTARHSL